MPRRLKNEKKTCFLMIFPKKEVKEYAPVTKNKKKNTSILIHHILVKTKMKSSFPPQLFKKHHDANTV